jgi:hypothetical protein
MAYHISVIPVKTEEFFGLQSPQTCLHYPYFAVFVALYNVDGKHRLSGNKITASDSSVKIKIQP